jgi:cytoskeletal protein RodZ
MIYSKNNTRQFRKFGIVALIVALFALAGVFIYQRSIHNNKKSTTPSGGSEAINLNPPTEQEKQEAEDNKQRLIQEESTQSPEPSNGSKITVSPVMGFLRQAADKSIEANGYVAEAVEANGTCILTLEKDGVKVVQEKQALPDAQSTVCGLIKIDRNRLTAGEWKGYLGYSSSKYQGTSPETIVRIE